MPAHHHLDRTLGVVNTIVLLISSFTMVMAVHTAQTGNRKRLVLFLVATLTLAAAFPGVKYVEYSHKFHDGFFAFCFSMAGLHGFHILGGMAAIGWVLRRSIRGDFPAGYYLPVYLVGCTGTCWTWPGSVSLLCLLGQGNAHAPHRSRQGARRPPASPMVNVVVALGWWRCTSYAECFGDTAARLPG